MAPLAHHVFFTLHDDSTQACEALVDACWEYLRDHEGIVSFAVGQRTADLNREVNDRRFHVSLHIVFLDRAAHDTYQQSARHQEFIEACRSGWAEVRVFDSDLQPEKPPR